MATGYGDPTSRYIGSSAFAKNVRDKQHSTDPDDMTLKVVDELKDIVRKKVRQGYAITQPIVELEVAKIRHDNDPNQHDIEELKAQLPRNLQNCSDSILRVSMAYGNDPEQIKPIIQSKMNSINSNDNIDNISLDNIIEPLKMLKKDLERNPLKNIFNAVRNINERNSDRADRLFLSEVLHFTPAIRDYKFDDAHQAVEAIRTTTYESERPEDLLSIVKTLRETDEIRQALNDMSKKSMRHKVPSTATSKLSDDDDHNSSVTTRMYDRKRFNENQNPSVPYSSVPGSHQNSPSYPNRPLNRIFDRSADNRNQATHHGSFPNLQEEFLSHPGNKT
ncbi:unnamed protein product [Rotaria sp. Silwood1]|nr:unnamed protein product [Rotaria sp. Silwood1]